MVPYLHVDKPGGIIGESEQTTQPGVPAPLNKASKPLTIKTCGGCDGRRNSQPHRRVHWREPQGPRMYTRGVKLIFTGG